MESDNMIMPEVGDDIIVKNGIEESVISMETRNTEMIGSPYCDEHIENSTDIVHANNTEQNEIIITSEGLVFPRDALMMSEEDEVGDNMTNHNNSECIDAPDFTIKVESKNMKSVVETVITDTDIHKNMSFVPSQETNTNEYQSSLDISTVGGLQKICNKNVFMNEAIVSTENKNQQMLLTSKLANHDHMNDSKAFMQLQTIDSNLFIKNESDITHSNPIKSEDVPYQPVVFIQLEGNNGTPQLIALTENISTTNDSNITTVQSGKNDKENRKKKRAERRIKPFHISPKTVNLEEKLLSDQKIYVGGKALPMIAPKINGLHPNISGQQSLTSKAFKFNLGLLMGEGEHFEVLGRCIPCYCFSRTTTYCRVNKRHHGPKASACIECDSLGRSTLVCRRKLSHKTPNASPVNIVINTAIQPADHIRQLCVKNHLPPCFAELQSITVHHAELPFVGSRVKNPVDDSPDITQNAQRKSSDYARGYLYPYTHEKWLEWLQNFCKQTRTSFSSRTGKRINKRLDHGIANHNNKIVTYRTLETHLLNCSLGGKPRIRPPKQGVRKRKERGSKLIGCTATLHTRLIITENDWEALEITAPKMLAHLSSHDPRVQNNNTTENNNASNFISNVEDLILVRNDMATETEEIEVVDSSSKVQRLEEIASPLQSNLRFDFIPVANNDVIVTDFKKDVLCDEKKRVKNLLLTCAGMIDMIDNEDVLTHIQDNTQTMLSKVLGELNTVASTSKPMSTKAVPSKKSDDFSSDDVVDNVSHMDEITHMISQVE